MHEYFTKAPAYLAAQGIKSGDFPVVDRDKNPIEWQEWIAYFEHIGLKETVRLMRWSTTRWTVPSLSPRDFDPITASIAIERRASA